MLLFSNESHLTINANMGEVFLKKSGIECVSYDWNFDNCDDIVQSWNDCFCHLCTDWHKPICALQEVFSKFFELDIDHEGRSVQVHFVMGGVENESK